MFRAVIMLFDFARSGPRLLGWGFAGTVESDRGDVLGTPYPIPRTKSGIEDQERTKNERQNENRRGHRDTLHTLLGTHRSRTYRDYGVTEYPCTIADRDAGLGGIGPVNVSEIDNAEQPLTE